jgi:hypothetical protein
MTMNKLEYAGIFTQLAACRIALGMEATSEDVAKIAWDDIQEMLKWTNKITIDEEN